MLISKMFGNAEAHPTTRLQVSRVKSRERDVGRKNIDYLYPLKINTVERGVWWEARNCNIFICILCHVFDLTSSSARFFEKLVVPHLAYGKQGP